MSYYSGMEFEAELEYPFPFQGEEEFPFQLFKVEKEDAPNSSDEFTDSDDFADDEEDFRFSNVFNQIVDINNRKTYSAVEYEAELKKRGAPFKNCLVNNYLCKFPFEDEEYLPNSEYYLSHDAEYVGGPNAHEIVKRFLKQVRESNGYDVDCLPPRLCSPFTPEDPNSKDKSFRDDVTRATHFVIEKIYSETGKIYELVKVDKVVSTDDSCFLLTFSVKKASSDDDGSLKTIRAMVYEPPCRGDDYILEEWMFKPPATPTDMSRVDMDPKKKKAKIGESTSNVPRLSPLETSHILCS